MQTENRLLDDLAKLMTNAAGAAQGVKSELDTLFRQRAERLMTDLDLVSRDEFDAVQAMAAEARAENARLEARLADLEARLVKQEKSAKPATARKSGTSAKSKAETTPDTGPES